MPPPRWDCLIAGLRYGPRSAGGLGPGRGAGPCLRPEASCSARSRTRSSSLLRSATSFRTSRAVVSSVAPAPTISAVRRTWARACAQGPSWSGGIRAGLVAEPVGLPEGRPPRRPTARRGRGARARRRGRGRPRSMTARPSASGQHGRPPARPAFGGGGGPRLGRGDLGGPGPLADRSQERRDLPGQDPRVAGPDRPRGVEAALGEPDQFILGAARVEPGEGVVEATGRRVLEDLGAAADVGRLPGQDLAEDRPQGEDVGLLVEVLDLAPRLLRAHVGRGADDRPRLRGQAPARRAHGRHQRLVGLAGLTPAPSSLARPDGGPSTAPSRPPAPRRRRRP